MSLIHAGSTYMFLNALSRTALDLSTGSQAPGTPVIGFQAHILDSVHVGRNQQWKASLAATGSDGTPYYSFQNVMSGLTLTLDASTDGTQAVGRWASASNDGQKFSFLQQTQIPNGPAQVNAYTVCSKIGGCLDIDGGNTTNGAPVIALPNGNHAEQTWMLVVLE